MTRGAWVAGWCLASLVPALACGEGDAVPAGPDAAHAVRDSAGVEIVESVEPAWSEDETWRLSADPLFRIRGSDGGEENLLLDPVSIDTDGRGRIIVADGNQVGWDAILVYDSLGQLLFRAGGSGEGPGEFGQLWWASSYRGDSIVGFDMAGSELAVFGPEGRFARTVRTPGLETPPPAPGTYGYVSGMDAAWGDGHFLAYPRGRFEAPSGAGPGWIRHELLRLAPDGESWDSLGAFEIGEAHWSGSRQETRWFAPFSFRVAGEDELFYGRGDAFRIERYGSTGRLTRVLRKAHEPRPVTDELKGALLEWSLERARSSPEGGEAMVERVREQMGEAEYADRLPAFSHAFLDTEGFLWVENFRWWGVEPDPLGGPGRWSVFDSAGIWLGDVETPPAFVLREATEDRVLGFVVDDFGVREIEVYGLERPGR